VDVVFNFFMSKDGTHDADVHAIYTLETGESFRASDAHHLKTKTTAAYTFAYYNRLATRIVAERDGVMSQVYIYDARNHHAVKLHSTEHGL
jgi:hypothetical protein